MSADALPLGTEALDLDNDAGLGRVAVNPATWMALPRHAWTTISTRLIDQCRITLLGRNDGQAGARGRTELVLSRKTNT